MTLPGRHRIAPGLAGACVLSLALMLSAQGSAQARSGLSDRPPLPAMGPSLRKAVAFATTEQPGTIIIRKNEKALYLVTRQGQALRYQISVGRDGFGWTGVVKVGAKTEWPQWRPPREMRRSPAGAAGAGALGPGTTRSAHGRCICFGTDATRSIASMAPMIPQV